MSDELPTGVCGCGAVFVQLDDEPNCPACQTLIDRQPVLSEQGDAE